MGNGATYHYLRMDPHIVLIATLFDNFIRQKVFERLVKKVMNTIEDLEHCVHTRLPDTGTTRIPERVSDLTKSINQVVQGLEGGCRRS